MQLTDLSESRVGLRLILIVRYLNLSLITYGLALH